MNQIFLIAFRLWLAVRVMGADSNPLRRVFSLLVLAGVIEDDFVVRAGVPILHFQKVVRFFCQ